MPTSTVGHHFHFQLAAAPSKEMIATGAAMPVFSDTSKSYVVRRLFYDLIYQSWLMQRKNELYSSPEEMEILEAGVNVVTIGTEAKVEVNVRLF